MQQLIQRLMQNKHTTVAGLIYIVCEVAAQIGAIWFPEHAAQFTQSLAVIQKSALGYGLLMAGDSGKNPPPNGPGDPKPPIDTTRIVGMAIIGTLIVLSFLKRSI